ncbi:hypothetical protein [Methanobrevibacter sp.]|uniref:hypothetical protein n=1 Tax=Methanobrevibacter sp. TaxID=66852 RepID=UPI003891013B
MRCPNCGEELDEDNYCDSCMQFFNDSDDLDFDYSNFYESDFNDDNFDDMVDNGDEICLNCTYWSVSPYCAAHGMICRKGNLTDGPGDSCGEFVQEHHFASYGDDGQFQFDETGRAISNKLYHWKNNR